MTTSETIVRILTEQVLLPLLMLAGTLVAGYVVPKLPGPLRDYLQSATNERDVKLVTGAMARRATATSTTDTPPASPADVIGYAERQVGSVMDKMGLTPEARQNMAEAAIVTATVAVAPVLPLPVTDPSAP